jgi:hypothetical protein
MIAEVRGTQGGGRARYPLCFVIPTGESALPFSPLLLRRADAKWRDLLLASRSACRVGTKSCRP